MNIISLPFLPLVEQNLSTPIFRSSIKWFKTVIYSSSSSDKISLDKFLAAPWIWTSQKYRYSISKDNFWKLIHIRLHLHYVSANWIWHMNTDFMPIFILFTTSRKRHVLTSCGMRENALILSLPVLCKRSPFCESILKKLRIHLYTMPIHNVFIWCQLEFRIHMYRFQLRTVPALSRQKDKSIVLYSIFPRTGVM